MKRHNGDDRYIADTLNTLSDLPQGYTPNLQSKWELLETSLAEQNRAKRVLTWRWRIAASVTLFAMLVILFKQPTKINTEIKPTVLVLSKPAFARAKTLELRLPEKPIKEHNTRAAIKSATPCVIIEDESVVPPEPALVYQSIETPTEPQPELPKKKSKTRFVQMDFGESSENITPLPYMASGMSIKLRSSVASQTFETYDEKTPKSIRIRF